MRWTWSRIRLVKQKVEPCQKTNPRIRCSIQLSHSFHDLHPLLSFWPYEIYDRVQTNSVVPRWTCSSQPHLLRPNQPPSSFLLQTTLKLDSCPTQIAVTYLCAESASSRGDIGTLLVSQLLDKSSYWWHSILSVAMPMSLDLRQSEFWFFQNLPVVSVSHRRKDNKKGEIFFRVALLVISNDILLLGPSHSVESTLGWEYQRNVSDPISSICWTGVFYSLLLYEIVS